MVDLVSPTTKTLVESSQSKPQSGLPILPIFGNQGEI
jgi:hypothetical protein